LFETLGFKYMAAGLGSKGQIGKPARHAGKEENWEKRAAARGCRAWGTKYGVINGRGLWTD